MSGLVLAAPRYLASMGDQLTTKASSGTWDDAAGAILSLSQVPRLQNVVILNEQVTHALGCVGAFVSFRNVVQCFNYFRENRDGKPSFKADFLNLSDNWNALRIASKIGKLFASVAVIGDFIGKVGIDFLAKASASIGQGFSVLRPLGVTTFMHAFALFSMVEIGFGIAHGLLAKDSAAKDKGFIENWAPLAQNVALFAAFYMGAGAPVALWAAAAGIGLLPTVISAHDKAMKDAWV